jgi:hypothetical protein
METKKSTTLHEEILNILHDAGNYMTTSEIAMEVNRRGFYRKRDGSPVTTYQIHGRTRKYPGIFTRSGLQVGLVHWLQVENDKGEQNLIKDDYIVEATLNISANANDVGKKAYLNRAGFECLGTIKNLQSGGLPRLQVLDSCGVYAISVPAKYSAIYIHPASALEKGNVICPWPLDRLSEKWVVGAEVLYYGIAGARSNRSLNKRIKDLLSHAYGNTTDRGPHKGGEILWQLKGWHLFSLWVLPTAGPPVPRQTETALLDSFSCRYGRLPFANRRK